MVFIVMTLNTSCDSTFDSPHILNSLVSNLEMSRIHVVLPDKRQQQSVFKTISKSFRTSIKITSDLDYLKEGSDLLFLNSTMKFQKLLQRNHPKSALLSTWLIMDHDLSISSEVNPSVFQRIYYFDSLL